VGGECDVLPLVGWWGEACKSEIAVRREEKMNCGFATQRKASIRTTTKPVENPISLAEFEVVSS
jgi:hypothetical protein